MFAHLGGILISFVAPLVIWLMHKGRGRYVEEQAKEALNWWITVAGVWIVLWLLTLILVAVTCSGRLFCTGGFLGFLPWLAAIGGVIFAIMGGIAANKGEPYRYPFAVRLIK